MIMSVSRGIDDQESYIDSEASFFGIVSSKTLI
jgi:hypothetical protein